MTDVNNAFRKNFLGKLSVERTLIKCVLAFVLCSSTVLHNSQSVMQDNGVGETLLSAAQTLHDLVLIGPAV